MSEHEGSLRRLPSIDRLLRHPRGKTLLERFDRAYILQHLRTVVDGMRDAVREGRTLVARDMDDAAILEQVETRIASENQSKLDRVVNATGTILHTNLGRALLAQPAVEALVTAATHAVNLEYDLVSGGRGRREDIIEELLVDLTG